MGSYTFSQKKEDINYWWILGLFMLYCVALILDERDIPSKIKFWDFSMYAFDVLDMFSFGIGLVLGGSTIFGYMLSKIDDRYLGLSVKYLLLKRKIYEHFNQTTCYIATGCSVFFLVIGFLLECRAVMIISISCVLCVYARLLYFIYIFTSKKSFVYYKIMSAIIKSNKNQNNIAKDIEKKIKLLEDKETCQKANDVDKRNEKEHDSYLEEKLFCLFLEDEYMGGSHPKNSFIVKEARRILTKDGREKEQIYDKEYWKYFENGYEEKFKKFINVLY